MTTEEEEEPHGKNLNTQPIEKLSTETQSPTLTSMAHTSFPNIQSHPEAHQEHHISTSSAQCASQSPQKLMALIDQVQPHQNMPLIDITDAFLHIALNGEVHDPCNIPQHDKDNSNSPPTFCLSAPTGRDSPVERAFVVEVKDTITSKLKSHNKKTPLGPLLRLFSGSKDKPSGFHTQDTSTPEPALISPSTPPGFPETAASPQQDQKWKSPHIMDDHPLPTPSAPALHHAASLLPIPPPDSPVLPDSGCEKPLFTHSKQILIPHTHSGMGRNYG